MGQKTRQACCGTTSITKGSRWFSSEEAGHWGEREGRGGEKGEGRRGRKGRKGRGKEGRGEEGKGREGRGGRREGEEEHDPLYSKFEKMVHASQDLSNTIILKDELQKKILQLLRTEFN